jgi:hypothetical protein
MSIVIITGGSGLVGTVLSAILSASGHEVIILGRGPAGYLPSKQSSVSYAQWDTSKFFIPPGIIEKADAIVHLAGAGVADKRWSAKRKKEIAESRTASSTTLVKALTETSNKVTTVVSASAIGWYGPDSVIPNPAPFVETDPADSSFLGETCRLWEESIEPVTSLGKRLVKLRIGIVLSKQGGALKEFMKLLRFGLASILGNGQQVISWIHIEDLCRIILAALDNATMQGVYNAVAPSPVNNKALTLQLAKALRGKSFIPVYVPAFVLKIMLGEMSIEVLKSTTVSANKLRNSGFKFLYPGLDAALNELVRKT